MAIAQTGVRIPASKIPASPEAAPPELPLTQWHNSDCEQDHTCTANHTPHHNLASVALIATQKKTHGASYVAFDYTGSHARLPILRQRKNYIRNAGKRQARKREFLQSGHHHARTPVCVRQCVRPSMR